MHENAIVWALSDLFWMQKPEIWYAIPVQNSDLDVLSIMQLEKTMARLKLRDYQQKSLEAVKAAKASPVWGAMPNMNGYKVISVDKLTLLNYAVLCPP